MRELNRKTKNILFFTTILCVLFMTPDCQKKQETQPPPGAVSEFGKYEGYSAPQYEEWMRTSQYLTMRDGVRLAVDVIRPAVDGKAVEGPLPCVWTHHRYHRAVVREGKIYSIVDRNRDLRLLVKYGYVIAAVDVRGGGASYGRYIKVFSEEETQDAYEITEWLAAQPWCDGNIGMYGGSYLGITQLMAASQAPPHLKAIFPKVAAFDLFMLVGEGGIYREGFINIWGSLTRQLDIEVPAAPVDEDTEGVMLKEAMAQHKDNWDVISEARKIKFRDDPLWGNEYAANTPSSYIEAINQSGIPVYIWGGWLDIYARDAFQLFVNLKTPKKLTVGAWPHGNWKEAINEERGRLLRIEQLRWFDYWLKGIDNGIMEEPPINYAVLHNPEKWSWHQASEWPQPESEARPYYFSDGKSGSVESVNDGILSVEAPAEGEGYDTYVVDYTTTTGEATRWHSGAGMEMNYPDLTENDSKGLTFTTLPLDEEVTVIGHPVVTLYVTSDASDGDFYAYLEEVDSQGYSHYITEGMLRASCRAVTDPPYDNLGLPFHLVSMNDIRNLSADKPAELIFDLHPVSNVFEGGHRIRLTVTCADKGNTELYKMEPTPTIKLYRSKEYPSWIQLPIINRR